MGKGIHFFFLEINKNSKKNSFENYILIIKKTKKENGFKKHEIDLRI